MNQTLTGEKIHIALNLTVATSSEESAHRIFVAISDITKYKQAELAIRQSHEKLAQSTYELEIRNREMALLGEMGNLFQSCQSSEEAYTVIAKYASRIFATESGSLYLFNASRNSLNAVATWGQPQETKRTFSPDACWAMRRGRMHVADGTGSEVVCTHLTHPTPVASLCIPLVAQGNTLGIITLIRVEPPEADSGKPDLELIPFSEMTLLLAAAFTEHIGLALANLKLQETLRHKAFRDPLTNLYNRRYMEESLERELKRAERKETPLGIIMFDIDHFKQFNDTVGHEAGDIVLRELGNFFKAHIRAGDVACRYGGEEFILILPESSRNDALQRAEEIREGVKQLNVLSNGAILGIITLSAGISVFPEHGKTVETLLRAADQALYLAKNEGRDRSVVKD
jgi:diguanylate cyclase (GGDEF)-like protein